MQELQKLQDRLEFERNLHKQQLATFQKSFIDGLVDKLSLEIQGLRDIATLCSDNVSQKIERRIANIEKILNQQFKKY